MIGGHEETSDCSLRFLCSAVRRKVSMLFGFSPPVKLIAILNVSKTLSAQKLSRYSSKGEVHIMNGIQNSTAPINPLWFRCQDKHTDFGKRSLNTNGEFSWNFTINFFQTTLYFCHFYWQSKQAIFDVFSSSVSADCGYRIENHDHICFWIATPSGFFISSDRTGTWKKRHDWT